MGSSNLEHLDQRFVEIYEATRAVVLERQKQKALIVVDDDLLLLYRGGQAVLEFPGLRPPLYLKMKTLGHIPLAVYCLLRGEAGRQIPQASLARIAAYHNTIEASAGELDTREEEALGLLPAPNQIYAKSLAILDGALRRGTVPAGALASYARDVCADITPVLAAAARAQLSVCHAHVTRIRNELLSPGQWAGLHVLILGPYMARKGEDLMQYFSHVLHTPTQGDHRLVYFDGDDLAAALDRLGTTILDADASSAIFGDRNRLHRDVLADATTQFLPELLASGDAADPAAAVEA